MYLNKFSVRINGKSESFGYVEMHHGETYTIVLRNDHKKPCDAIVEIDGKEVGTFRIESHSNFYLERPVNEQKKFTFYKINTLEWKKSGLNKIDKNTLGLIKVTFKLERNYQYTPVSQIKKPKRVKNKEFYINVSSLNGNSKINDNISFSETDSHHEYFVYDDMTQSINEYKFFNNAETRTGGTGLSGVSNQSFITACKLDYDEEHTTEIYLRLISIKENREDPTELKPIVKSTTIPPPLF